MPRYYFHFLWPDDAVVDKEGLELENYTAAYSHACAMVQQIPKTLPSSRWGLVDRSR